MNFNWIENCGKEIPEKDKEFWIKDCLRSLASQKNFPKWNARDCSGDTFIFMIQHGDGFGIEIFDCKVQKSAIINFNPYEKRNTRNFGI